MSRRIILSAAIFSIILVLANCQPKDSEVTGSTNPPDIEEMALGFSVLEANCFSCHSPNPDRDELVAPTIASIRSAYLDSDTDLASFAASIRQFVLKPGEAPVKMPGALSTFGPMPAMDFSNRQLDAVAVYIYYNAVDAPGWYATNYRREKKKYESIEVEVLSDLEKGKQYAMATKAVLGKNLLNAIKTSGTENAFAYCNLKAIPLTDSMEQKFNVGIRRVSDKNRNPENAADSNELRYIQQCKSDLSLGKNPMAAIEEINGETVGYYPIITNEMCLQCHGTPGVHINQATMHRLEKLYPGDRATGYGVNELRGIWVISSIGSSK